MRSRKGSSSACWTRDRGPRPAGPRANLRPLMTAPSTKAIASARPRATRQGPLGLIRQGLAEIEDRRRLTRYLVGAELKRTHADTAFGQLWWIVDPLLQMAVYYI